MRLPSMVLPSCISCVPLDPPDSVLLTTPVTNAMAMTTMTIIMVVRLSNGQLLEVANASYIS